MLTLTFFLLCICAGWAAWLWLDSQLAAVFCWSAALCIFLIKEFKK